MQNLTPSARPALDFEPVPRKYRYDGWTAERQRAFIAALAETGSVKAAARRINMSPEGAYHLRRQPAAASFAAAWNAALDHGVQCLTDIAIDRAIEGVPVPIHWQGQMVGEKRVYDNRLLQFVLRHHLPDRYGAPGLRPGTRSPETVAREAAENCPVCRKRAEDEADLTPDDAESRALKAYMDDLCKRYAAKVRYERRRRLEGDVVAADFTVRQLTQIELMLAAGGSARYCAAVWQDAEEQIEDPESTVSEIGRLLERVRNAVWQEEQQPRPHARADSLRDGTGGFWNGGSPTAPARRDSQAEALRQMAAAQAMWEAAASEETWAAWLAGGEGCAQE